MYFLFQMNHPRVMTLRRIIKWIAVVFLTTYLVCTPFRGYKERSEKIFYTLIQAYVKSGLLHLPIPSQVHCRNRNVFLLIMVPSAVSNFEQRSAIRKTWGNVSIITPSVLVKFMLGKSRNSIDQTLAETENSIYNDILFEDILETYENLSLKSIAILHWAMENCEGVSYLLKIDDDMFLNLPRLLKELKAHPKMNSITGCKVSGAYPFRSAFSKWKISRDEYENDYYPEYMAGTAYLISGDIISSLYSAAKRVPYFIFEDVYITGLCRQHIGAAALQHKGFSCGYRDAGPCGKNFRYKITGHHYTPDEVQRMWLELQDRWSKCRIVDTYFIYRLVDLFKYMFL